MRKLRESAICNPPMQLLLVGASEEDRAYLCDLLTQTGDGQVGLDSAGSLEEARTCLAKATYNLVLCNYHAGDGVALRLLHEVRRDKNGSSIPVIFLSDHVNQERVEATLKGRVGNGVPASSLKELSVIRTIRYAVDVYCKERQRQTAEDTLRKLWRAVERSADLVMITDRAGAIEYVNPAFEALTGYSREEAVGHNPRILKSTQQAPELYRELWETLLAGNVFRGVLANRKKNGEIFLAEKTITPLRDAEGKITHFISNDRDITERRRLETQLQQAQKMDAIGRLAGGVAHDFNNLLMVISAYAELMQDSMTAEHPLRRHVTEIQTASRRAADLTRQLLAFGRKQMQALRLLDLNTVIQDINRMLPRLIGEDIELMFVPGADLGRVRADPVQIEQIVMNLAANARDAMPHGGKLIIETASVQLDESYSLRHSIVPAGDYVQLVVTDSGEGIAPEHLPHIFEPFYTTKQEGKGSGLGLATVYGIVKQNGGFIWVYGEPGLGTTFKIYLPRVQAEKAQAIQPPKLLEPSAKGSETVLLVEDEDAVRQSAREFLTLNGYTVLAAKNGEEGLCVARDYSGSIELMITDVVMPHLGGAKLAARLSVERPAMQVLFVSGYAENTVLQHGAIDMTSRFLQKPFSLKALARKMREVIESKAAVPAAPVSSR